MIYLLLLNSNDTVDQQGKICMSGKRDLPEYGTANREMMRYSSGK